MAVEWKLHRPEMDEDGIYFVNFSVTTSKFKFAEDIVYAPYTHERALNNIKKNFTNKDLGINEKSNAKQIVNVTIKIIKYLSKVNADTYARWKNSTENSKNNLTT